MRRHLGEFLCAYSFLAIILLSRPPLAVAFLDGVKDVPMVKEGKVAIIQFDPSNVITYDVLRFWRLELSKLSMLGAAGESLFILTALPYGRGYNASSSLLQSVSVELTSYLINS